MDEVTADGNAGLPTDGGSVFARILQAIDVGDLTDETAYVVHRGGDAFAILNAYPYGTGHLLVQAQGQGFVGGYFDHAGQLWDEAGDLLATTHQVVYYKE